MRRTPPGVPMGNRSLTLAMLREENMLSIQPAEGKGAVRAIKLTGAGFYDQLKWSPDSKKISFVDNSRSLYILDLASGEIRKIDSDELYTPGTFRDIASDCLMTRDGWRIPR